MKESEEKDVPKSPDAVTASLDRRTFVKLVPALGAAAVIAPHVSAISAQTPTPSPTPLLSPSPSPCALTR